MYPKGDIKGYETSSPLLITQKLGGQTRQRCLEDSPAIEDKKYMPERNLRYKSGKGKGKNGDLFERARKGEGRGKRHNRRW